jgi:hypothetical protein
VSATVRSRNHGPDEHLKDLTKNINQNASLFLSPSFSFGLSTTQTMGEIKVESNVYDGVHETEQTGPVVGGLEFDGYTRGGLGRHLGTFSTILLM